MGKKRSKIEELRDYKVSPSWQSTADFKYNPSSNVEADPYLAARAKGLKTIENIQAGLGLGQSVFDFFQQRKEEREAQALKDKIVEPRYSTRSRSPELARELRDVDARRLNPYGMVSPLADQINLGYQQDLARGQAVSGGQASTAAALGQAAALNRDAKLSVLGRAASEALGSQDQRALQLSSALADDASNRDYLNFAKYQTDTGRMLQEGTAVGEAIASAKLRKLQARNDAWVSLLSSPVFDINTYENMLKKSMLNRDI